MNLRSMFPYKFRGQELSVDLRVDYRPGEEMTFVVTFMDRNGKSVLFDENVTVGELKELVRYAADLAAAVDQKTH